MTCLMQISRLYFQATARRGVALTRDEILQTVWDYDYTGETRTVDMHVKALRQKLGDDVIATVRGVGYKMP